MNGLQFDLALTALAATEARRSVYADRLQRFTFGAMVADNRYWRPELAEDEHERAGFQSVVAACHTAALVEDADRRSGWTPAALRRLQNELDRTDYGEIVPMSNAEVAALEAAYEPEQIDPERDARQRAEFEQMRKEWFEVA